MEGGKKIDNRAQVISVTLEHCNSKQQAMWQSPMCAKLLQSCLTLCDPIDRSAPRLLCPWDSSSKNTGVICCALLQRIFPGIKLMPHTSPALAGRFFTPSATKVLLNSSLTNSKLSEVILNRTGFASWHHTELTISNPPTKKETNPFWSLFDIIWKPTFEKNQITVASCLYFRDFPF